jgi:hypothetical protein
MKNMETAAERRFASPPTEMMIREWRKQRKGLIKADKSKKGFRSCAPKWPKLEEHVKNWIINLMFMVPYILVTCMLNSSPTRCTLYSLFLS